jgi:hypothetical protein
MWPFDQNKHQMYEQYANHADQGTYGQIPEQEARQNYQQFVQNAPPQMSSKRTRSTTSRGLHSNRPA